MCMAAGTCTEVRPEKNGSEEGEDERDEGGDEGD
jgi:hypothetical protein